MSDARIDLIRAYLDEADMALALLNLTNVILKEVPSHAASIERGTDLSRIERLDRLSANTARACALLLREIPGIGLAPLNAYVDALDEAHCRIVGGAVDLTPVRIARDAARQVCYTAIVFFDGHNDAAPEGPVAKARKPSVRSAEAIPRVREYLRNNTDRKDRSIAKACEISASFANRLKRLIEEQDRSAPAGREARERSLTGAMLHCMPGSDRDPAEIVADDEEKLANLEIQYLLTLDADGRHEYRSLPVLDQQRRVAEFLVGEPDPHPDQYDDTL